MNVEENMPDKLKSTIKLLKPLKGILPTHVVCSNIFYVRYIMLYHKIVVKGNKHIMYRNIICHVVHMMS